MAVTMYDRATGNLQNLKSGDSSQGFWNLTRKAVVIKTAVLARRHPEKKMLQSFQEISLFSEKSWPQQKSDNLYY